MTYNIGDKVGVDHYKYPGVWIIDSRGPKNTVLKPEGGGRGLKVPHSMLIDPGASLAPRLSYSPGEFVRIPDGRRYAGLWVVTNDPGKDRVSVAKPGGNGVQLGAVRRELVKVSLEDALKELVDQL